MQYQGLLAKIAFICNLFFGVCILLQRAAPAGASVLVSQVAILGLVLGMCIVNPLTNVLNGAALLRRKKLPAAVPVWLALTNFIFLLLQLFYILHTWS